MPDDDTRFVHQIAEAERNGNYNDAFHDALKFIYGDPSLLSTDGTGWKDRANQLNTDLINQHLIPPFKIVDDDPATSNVDESGIEIQNSIATQQAADGGKQVNYASGVSLTINADLSKITIKDPAGGQSGTFTRVDDQGNYIQDPAPVGLQPLKLQIIRNDKDLTHPSFVIRDGNNNSNTVTENSSNGDVTFSQLDSNGQVSYSNLTQANGLKIYTSYSNGQPQVKDITYLDGTRIEVMPSQERDNQGNHTTWTTTVNIPDYHAGAFIKLPYDITDGAAELPPDFSFQDPSTGINYTFDNQTLKMTATNAQNQTSAYYMSGVEPDITNPHEPVPQSTPTATVETGKPYNPFEAATPGG